MSKFTWGSQCDSDIYNKGSQVLLAACSSAIADKFVETVSNKLDCKLDYHMFAGRVVIKTMPENYDKVMEYINSLTPYDMEEYGITQYM